MPGRRRGGAAPVAIASQPSRSASRTKQSNLISRLQCTSGFGVNPASYASRKGSNTEFQYSRTKETCGPEHGSENRTVVVCCAPRPPHAAVCPVFGTHCARPACPASGGTRPRPPRRWHPNSSCARPPRHAPAHDRRHCENLGKMAHGPREQGARSTRKGGTKGRERAHVSLQQERRDGRIHPSRHAHGDAKPPSQAFRRPRVASHPPGQHPQYPLMRELSAGYLGGLPL